MLFTPPPTVTAITYKQIDKAKAGTHEDCEKMGARSQQKQTQILRLRSLQCTRTAPLRMTEFLGMQSFRTGIIQLNSTLLNSRALFKALGSFEDDGEDAGFVAGDLQGDVMVDGDFGLDELLAGGVDVGGVSQGQVAA